MNLAHFKRNIGYRVKLHPVAIRLDFQGRELSDVDDDWDVVGVTDTVRIINVSTGHIANLGLDHIHHFTSNPARTGSAIGYGFLTLMVQLFLQGNSIVLRPTARPGERTTLDGRSVEAQVARSLLLDQRLQIVMADYHLRGTPRPIIDTFDDLSTEEKASLYDKAIRLKRGRPSKNNPYR